MKELMKNYNKTVISNAYELFGSFVKGDNVTFRLWAPNAQRVSVVGDFNGWNPELNPMKKADGGCWETVINGLDNFLVYKYSVTRCDGSTVLKSDPYARHFETAPANASKIYKDDKYILSSSLLTFASNINLVNPFLNASSSTSKKSQQCACNTSIGT